MGVQQGGPPGPLLLATALHSVIQKLRGTICSDTPSATAHPTVMTWYLSDGCTAVLHAAMRRVLDFLNSEEVRHHGLHLQMSECQIWWPTPTKQSVQHLHPSHFLQSYAPGTLTLKPPVGSTQPMTSTVVEHAASLQPLLTAVATLCDVQVSLYLLRSGFGTCRITHPLRAVRAHCTQDEAAAFDEMMESCLRTVVGRDLSEDLFKEMQLALAQIENKPFFGAELRFASTSAGAAFLASFASTRSLCNKMLFATRQKRSLYLHGRSLFA